MLSCIGLLLVLRDEEVLGCCSADGPVHARRRKRTG